ncbi:Egd1 protein [Starmerella bacillaris]|uniref:Nascent polypeptide-associated complex subunit beta n=1 Tax=Starmerella bacillaris TaxID=1247836 RepID=A0AAV5RGC3_STABA|nr:Egd1 protein [Starmerella bacillaris]
MDSAKLERLRANVRIGGKGTPRRKLKKNVKSEADDTKVQAALQKLNAVTMTGVTQVTLAKDDGNVITFGRPAVQHAPQYNTFAIHGHSVERSAEEMIPEAMKNLTPEQLKQFQEITEKLNKQAQEPAADDAEIPNLVEGESFDKVD